MSFSEVQITASALVSGISATTSNFASAQTAGDFIVVGITWSISSASISTVTDTSGNTYSQIGATSTGNGGNTFQSVYLATNIKAASANSNAVTCTFTSSSAVNNVVRAIEFSCSAGSGVTLRSHAETSGSSTNADSGAATTTAGDLLYACFVLFGGYTSPGTGYTTGNNVSGGGYVDEYNVSSPGGSQHGICNSAAGLWLANLVVIAPPAIVAAFEEDTSRQTFIIEQSVLQNQCASDEPPNASPVYDESVSYVMFESPFMPVTYRSWEEWTSQFVAEDYSSATTSIPDAATIPQRFDEEWPLQVSAYDEGGSLTFASTEVTIVVYSSIDDPLASPGTFDESASIVWTFLESASLPRLSPEEVISSGTFDDVASTVVVFPEVVSFADVKPEEIFAPVTFDDAASVVTVFPEFISFICLTPEEIGAPGTFDDAAAIVTVFQEVVSFAPFTPEELSTPGTFDDAPANVTVFAEVVSFARLVPEEISSPGTFDDAPANVTVIPESTTIVIMYDEWPPPPPTFAAEETTGTIRVLVDATLWPPQVVGDEIPGTSSIALRPIVVAGGVGPYDFWDNRHPFPGG